MVTKIKCNNERLHFKELEVKSRLNVLVGGNGVGKTTFLKGLKEGKFKVECSKDIEYISYTDSVDNYVNRHGEVRNLDECVSIMEANSMSEGQGILYSLLSFLQYIEERLEILGDSKSIVVLLDEVDSGLSVDAINVLLHEVIRLLSRYEGVQFFISSNNYHFTYVINEVVNMYSGEYITINNYDEYFKIMVQGMQEVAKKSNSNFLKVNKWIEHSLL